ncbi:MAG: hypothetical protein FWD58_04525 [Firmicutes bacterium]|nr:hypothetical protein [Bacillota bacterium]
MLSEIDTPSLPSPRHLPPARLFRPHNGGGSLGKLATPTAASDQWSVERRWICIPSPESRAPSPEPRAQRNRFRRVAGDGDPYGGGLSTFRPRDTSP